ncbi:MAG: AfsR/SARP family transcriptional regulator [Stackebrandtia sp.]
MQVRLCGPVELVGPLGSRTPSGRIRRGLLASLALSSGRYVTATRLIEQCWEEPTGSAQANLRSHLAGLRRDLEIVARGSSGMLTSLRGSGGSYRMNNLGPQQLDLVNVQWLVTAARRSLRGGERETALLHCMQAKHVWRGSFGADLPATEYFTAQAGAILRTYQQYLEIDSAAQLCAGQYRSALDKLHNALAEHPDRAAFWQLLATACFLNRDTSAALAAVDECRARRLDIGLDLPAEIAALQRHILSDDRPAILTQIHAQWGPHCAEIPA